MKINISVEHAIAKKDEDDDGDDVDDNAGKTPEIAFKILSEQDNDG